MNPRNIYIEILKEGKTRIFLVPIFKHFIILSGLNCNRNLEFFFEMWDFSQV